MSTMEHKIAVMKASGEGATIEHRSLLLPNSEYRDVRDPAWNWAHFDYRIKPPERKTVKLLAYYDGCRLSWRLEGGPRGSAEQRVPAEDKTIEIE